MSCVWEICWEEWRKRYAACLLAYVNNSCAVSRGGRSVRFVIPLPSQLVSPCCQTPTRVLIEVTGGALLQVWLLVWSEKKKFNSTKYTYFYFNSETNMLFALRHKPNKIRAAQITEVGHIKRSRGPQVPQFWLIRRERNSESILYNTADCVTSCESA